jgi:glucose/mannose transport system substrate-binding protein
MKRALLAVPIVLAAASCLSSTSASQVEMYSWWVSGAEKTALDTVLNDFHERNPSITVNNLAERNSISAQADLATRMREGNPPDTFQVNSGVELCDYVTANELDVVDDIEQSQDWLHNMSATVRTSVYCQAQGHYYAVPVNFARVNVVFYNKTMFANLAVPQTLEQFESAAEKLRANGVQFPVAIGAQIPWTLEVIFKDCLVAEAERAGYGSGYGPGYGAAYYKTFTQHANQSFLSNAGPPDQVFDAALQCFARIVGYADPGQLQNSPWYYAVSQVVNGAAAMTIMGEWAAGEFANDMAMPGRDFDEFVFPDSGDTFIYTVDAFTLPVNAPDRPAAVALLTDWGSPAAQQLFYPSKGTLAARTDVDASAYDSLQLRTLRTFQATDAGELVPDFPLAVPQTFTTAFDAALAHFVDDGNAENVVLAVKNNYYLVADHW